MAITIMRLSGDFIVQMREGETPEQAVERFIGDLCDYDGIPDNALFRGEGRATDDLLAGLFQGAEVVVGNDADEEDEIDGSFSGDFYTYSTGGR